MQTIQQKPAVEVKAVKKATPRVKKLDERIEITDDTKSSKAVLGLGKLKTKMIAAGTAIIIVSTIAISMSGPGFEKQVAAEHLPDFTKEMADQNRIALEKNGLSRNFRVRDFGAVDQDEVILNGSPAIVLTGSPTPVAAAPGSMNMKAIAGTQGCVSIEVQDDKLTYQLCLQDGEQINTFIKE